MKRMLTLFVIAASLEFDFFGPQVRFLVSFALDYYEATRCYFWKKKYE